MSFSVMPLFVFFFQKKWQDRKLLYRNLMTNNIFKTFGLVSLFFQSYATFCNETCGIRPNVCFFRDVLRKT